MDAISICKKMIAIILFKNAFFSVLGVSLLVCSLWRIPGFLVGTTMGDIQVVTNRKPTAQRLNFSRLLSELEPVISPDRIIGSRWYSSEEREIEVV